MHLYFIIFIFSSLIISLFIRNISLIKSYRKLEEDYAVSIEEQNFWIKKATDNLDLVFKEQEKLEEAYETIKKLENKDEAKDRN